MGKCNNLNNPEAQKDDQWFMKATGECFKVKFDKSCNSQQGYRDEEFWDLIKFTGQV